MINLLDYILDNNDNFWIVNYIDNEYKGYMVYKVDKEGNRFNNITKKRYIKCIQQDISIIPKPYKKIFHANEFYLKNKSKLTGVWREYVNVLNEIGISDKDIGIFGSYLIGFDITKDVDFVIYGKNNLNLYYQNAQYIRDCIKATKITLKHIKYQYDKHKKYYPKNTDFLKIIARNWSGVQICDGVLSTPRFVDLNNQTSPIDKGVRKVVRCQVIDGKLSSMLPRRASVLYNGEIYSIITNLWKYQSFLEDGDKIECLADVDDINKTIYLSDYKCYVKYLN